MVTWILILFAHVGAMGSGNSNALTSVPGFASQAECSDAGKAAKALVAGTVKEISYACVRQTK